MHPEYDFMGDPFVRVVEETAELNLAIAKAHRFGLFHHHESQKHSNFDQIRFEIADVYRTLGRLDAYLASLARIRDAGRNPPEQDTRISVEGAEGSKPAADAEDQAPHTEGDDSPGHHSPAPPAGAADYQRRSFARAFLKAAVHGVFDDKEIPADATPHRSDRTGA